MHFLSPRQDNIQTIQLQTKASLIEQPNSKILLSCVPKVHLNKHLTENLLRSHLYHLLDVCQTVFLTGEHIYGVERNICVLAIDGCA